MKYKLFQVLPLFVLLISLSTCKGKETQETNILSGVTGVPAHPRILMLNADLVKIKERVESDSTWKIVHATIIRESDRLLKKPLVEYKLDGKRLLERSRECRKKVFYLSYAWRFTNDIKYLKKAEEELLNVSAFKDWNPSHFLDVAEMTMAVAIGYDWLYNDLSPETRKKLSEAIIRKGLQPSMQEGNNWWLTESGNWNQVCNAGMTFGALAIYDEDNVLAQKIIDRSVNSVQLAMKVYEPDGVYPEGYSYWSYGTTFNVYLLDALKKAFETDFGLLQNKGFLKTASYLLNMVGPTGLNFNYSDGKSECKPNPAMFWFANQLQDPSLLFSEILLMNDKENIRGRELPAIVIWGATINMDKYKLPEPQQLLWDGQGKNPVAMMRSSWKRDALYIGLKGGSPDMGHGHMDAGSFVFDAMGERWAIDLGPQDYGKLEAKGIDLWNRKQQSERWNIFRLNNRSHNTLTFNNELQLVNGNAPIIQSTTDKSFLSATVNLTSIYKNHTTKTWRGAAIVDQKYVVIKDEIETISTSTIQWAMMTSASVRLVNDQTAELNQNGKKLLLKVVEPGNAKIKTWLTTSINDFDEPNPGTTKIGFEVQLQPKSKTTLTVHLIPEGIDELKEYPAQLKMWSSK